MSNDNGTSDDENEDEWTPCELPPCEICGKPSALLMVGGGMKEPIGVCVDHLDQRPCGYCGRTDPHYHDRDEHGNSVTVEGMNNPEYTGPW